MMKYRCNAKEIDAPAYKLSLCQNSNEESGQGTHSFIICTVIVNPMTLTPNADLSANVAAEPNLTQQRDRQRTSESIR